MAWLDDLKATTPPPVTALAPAPRWAEVEALLGLPIPEDLKVLTAAYGQGGLGGFLWLLHPGSVTPRFETVHAVAEFDSAYAKLRQAHPGAYPLPSLPKPASFLPWAVTDNGDHLGWIVGSKDPVSWTVAVLDGEGGRPERFPLPLGPFLGQLATGRVRPRAFPIDAFADLPLRWMPRPG